MGKSVNEICKELKIAVRIEPVKIDYGIDVEQKPIRYDVIAVLPCSATDKKAAIKNAEKYLNGLYARMK